MRPGRHIPNYRGHSLADRRNYGHTAAVTASIMVTSDLGDSGVVRDPHSVIRFEHTAKILRSRMFFGSAATSVDAEPQHQGQPVQQELIEVHPFKSESTHQQAEEKSKTHTIVVSSGLANFSAEDLDLGGYVEKDRGRLATFG